MKKYPLAHQVRSGVWSCDSPRPPQNLNRFACFDPHRFFDRGRAKLVLDVHLRAKIDQQLHGIRVVLDGQIMQGGFAKAVRKLRTSG